MYVRVICRFIAASLADGGFRERNSGLGVCMYVPTANTKYELAACRRCAFVSLAQSFVPLFLFLFTSYSVIDLLIPSRRLTRL